MTGLRVKAGILRIESEQYVMFLSSEREDLEVVQQLTLIEKTESM